MNTNLIIQFLASKFQVEEWTITGNVDSWSAISSTGITTTKEDYTSKELNDFIKAYETAQLAENATKEAAKSALLAKLGITADEAKLLLS